MAVRCALRAARCDLRQRGAHHHRRHGPAPTGAGTTLSGEWILATLSGTLTQGEHKPEPAVTEKALQEMSRRKTGGPDAQGATN
jgi:hypothetical protein